MTDRTKATRDSWKTLPMPKARKKLLVTKHFSQDEYDRIACGLIPKRMEDKWFIFLEGDQLNLHRSWTGQSVYQVKFKQNQGEWEITEAWVNRDPDQYRSPDDDYDVVLLSFLIDNFLLGKNTPFPIRNDLPKDIPKGVYQHGIAGSGYPEIEIKKKPSNHK